MVFKVGALMAMVALFLGAKAALAAPAPNDILTPPAPPGPRINGPTIFGVRPGNPLLFTIAATGDAPIHYQADHLPDGVHLDAENGQLSGICTTAGKYELMLHATNDRGSAQRSLTLVVGDQIALTPPMGWNTYYAFRLNISDALVRKQTAAMVSSGLINHGWSYLSIDEGWENKPGAKSGDLSGPGRDTAGAIVPNRKFPDMTALCRDIHAQGLKIGIYSSPGPLCCGGSEGTYQHEDQDARTFADWGFDYVKYDWCSYAKIARDARIEEYARLLPASARELKSLLTLEGALEDKRPRTPDDTRQLGDVTQKLEALYAQMDPGKKKQVDVKLASAPYQQFAASLAKVKRDMLFSFCQYGMDDVWEWGKDAGGNSWRTHRDIIDDWTRVSTIGFGEAGLENYAGPGHWNDPDILQVGVENKGIPSRLTADEQYTHVSLWCLLSAPLLIGGDLTKLDPFTLNLLTNDEVLAVDQDSLGIEAHRISQDGGAEVWAKKMADGSQAVGLFNRDAEPRQVVVSRADLHLSGRQRARDLWRQKDLGDFTDRFQALVPPHGVLLISVAG
jgi:alpha-galactosidase